MKYKNIVSAIHNFGHSFLSDMNYVDSDFVFNELRKLHKKEYDVSIDWKTKEFSPKTLCSGRILKSIDTWHSSIHGHFEAHNLDFTRLKRFELLWNAGETPKVVALDDRGKLYEKFITKTF